MTTYDDFPILGDFDGSEDWLHEVKKSKFKYVMNIPKIPSDYWRNFNDVSFDKGFVYIGDCIGINGNTSFEIKTNNDHTVVIVAFGFHGKLNMSIFSTEEGHLETFRMQAYVRMINTIQAQGRILIGGPYINDMAKDCPIIPVSEYSLSE